IWFCFVSDQCLELLDVVVIRRDIGQRLCDSVSWVFPRSGVLPSDRADVDVHVEFWAVSGFGRHLTTTTDRSAPPLGIDDVAYGDFVLELPQREDCVLHRPALSSVV